VIRASSSEELARDTAGLAKTVDRAAAVAVEAARRASVRRVYSAVSMDGLDELAAKRMDKADGLEIHVEYATQAQDGSGMNAESVIEARPRIKSRGNAVRGKDK
jgi:hypothetical protein